MRQPSRSLSPLVVALVLGVVAALTASPLGAPSASAAPPPPEPVYVASHGEAADPGLLRVAGDEAKAYYAFMTGGVNGLAKVATAPNPQGPWTEQPDALARWGGWASGAGAVWAPDVVRTSAGYVLYYAAQAKGFAGQRCIGTAISDQPGGPYEPADTPLVCPRLGGEDPAADRPDPTSGVIDPAPFQAADGQRYLTYKTQKTPGTIRLVALSADGLHATGTSRELVRHSDSIENPVIVQRGDTFVLFASANWYDQCRYSTVWRASTDIWAFADKEEHVLLDQASTGICGPGGADVVTGGDGPDRIVLHGWVCSAANAPCQYDALVTDPAKRRVLYAGVLTWGDDGKTPVVPTLLRPIGR